LPYKLGNIEAVVNPNFTFGKKDALYIIGSIDLGNYKDDVKISASVKSIFNNRYSKTYDILVQKGRVTYFKKFMNTVPPGNYKVLLKILSKSGVVLDKKASSFSVNLREYSKTPASIHKFTKLDNLFTIYRVISYQYKNIGKFNKALKYILKAYNLNSNSPKVFYDYSDLLLAKKDFKTVLNIVERFKNTKGSEFIYNSVKGRALYSKGNYNEAINVLEEANKLYDSDIKVLNTLGMAYLKMGVNKQAKKALKASLKINPKQEKIKKILKNI
jgi:tetratricopeptide (TPR) repeat protein